MSIHLFMVNSVVAKKVAKGDASKGDASPDACNARGQPGMTITNIAPDGSVLQWRDDA